MSSDKAMPNVTLNDVLEDKQLLDVIRSSLEPAIDALVYRAAMVSKQFALSAIHMKPSTETDTAIAEAVGKYREALQEAARLLRDNVEVMTKWSGDSYDLSRGSDLEPTIIPRTNQLLETISQLTQGGGK